MPAHINDFVNDNFDRDDLELFLLAYHNRAEHGLSDNFVDFINGFTLALVYAHREKFPDDENRKWLRIRISMQLAPLYSKLMS